ncbi:MAG: TRAP transporter substrate-binding protein [candidate division NC10 bacterium]|nr:TRAP transporter substrate-binding protein [candidate division NC10 bacterium]
MKTGMCSSAILVVALSTLLLSSTPSEAAKRVIRFAGTAAASVENPEYVAMVKFKEAVEQKTKDIAVQIYPANQLGATKEFMEGVALGTVEMAEVGYDIIGLVDKMAYALTMPYLHTSLEHYIKVVEGPIGEEIHQHMVKTTGIRVLGALNRGPRHLMNSVRPVHGPSDLKGLKIRSPENPLNAGTIRAMGATPVPISWGEVYTSLSQGVADGVENSIDELFTARLHEVQKHLSLTQHIYVAVPIIINDRFYQGLSADLQGIIAAAAKESVLWRRAELKTSEEKSLAAMKRAGVQVVTTPRVEEFAERAKEVWKEFQDGKTLTWDLINRIRQF